MRTSAGAVAALAAAATFALTGCGIDTAAAGAAAGAAQASAASGVTAQERAARQVAAQVLIVSTQRAARVHEQMNGDLTGFAAQFAQAEAAVMAQLDSLDDRTVSVPLGDGQCLSAALPSGPAEVTTCA